MSQNRLAMSAVIMAVCNVAKVGLQLVMTPTLAHLLGPSNYGLYALAQPSILFVMMLADAGLGQSLAREPEAHTKVWSSAFWLLLLLGVVLALGVAGWSFPLAMFTRQPNLPVVMTALSACIVLLTVTVPPSARLTRRGRIEAYSLVDLAANLISAAVAVGMALAGAGVWSLVGQMLCLYAVRAVGTNVLAFQRPRLEFDWRAVAPHTMLGGGIVLTKFIDSLGRLLEATVVGRRFGPSGLGMYSLAGQAAWSVVQGVNNPTGTMLYAHAIRADALEEVRLLYLRLVRVTALLTLPATMIVAALAPLLAASLLGRAWQGQAPLLLAMIFPSQALGTLCQLGGAVLYAQGRARSQVWLSLINALLRVSAVTLPFGGLPALAIGIAVANVLYAVCGLINNRIQLGWRIRDTVQVTAGPALASCAAAAAAYFVSRIAPWDLLGLIVAACAGGLVFCVVLAVIDFERLKSDWRGAAHMLRAKAA